MGNIVFTDDYYKSRMPHCHFQIYDQENSRDELNANVTMFNSEVASGDVQIYGGWILFENHDDLVLWLIRHPHDGRYLEHDDAVD